MAPYNFSKKLNGTLVYNIFLQIYHLDESKQLIMINQRLEFTKRQRTVFKLTLLWRQWRFNMAANSHLTRNNSVTPLFLFHKTFSFVKNNVLIHLKRNRQCRFFNNTNNYIFVILKNLHWRFLFKWTKTLFLTRENVRYYEIKIGGHRLFLRVISG